MTASRNISPTLPTCRLAVRGNTEANDDKQGDKFLMMRGGGALPVLVLMAMIKVVAIMRIMMTTTMVV